MSLLFGKYHEVNFFVSLVIRVISAQQTAKGMHDSDRRCDEVSLFHLFHLREASDRQQQRERLLPAMEQTRLVTRPHSILPPPHYFFIELFILHSGMTGRYLETSHSLNTQAEAGAAGVEFTSKCKQNFM